MPQVATILKRVELDAARVITTDSVRVSGILVSNGTAGPLTANFRDNDGTEIITLHVAANDNDSWDVLWIADNGLNVDSAGDADFVVTVAHGQPGA